MVCQHVTANRLHGIYQRPEITVSHCPDCDRIVESRVRISHLRARIFLARVRALRAAVQLGEMACLSCGYVGLAEEFTGHPLFKGGVHCPDCGTNAQINGYMDDQGKLHYAPFETAGRIRNGER